MQYFRRYGAALGPHSQLTCAHCRQCRNRGAASRPWAKMRNLQKKIIENTRKQLQTTRRVAQNCRKLSGATVIDSCDPLPLFHATSACSAAWLSEGALYQAPKKGTKERPRRKHEKSVLALKRLQKTTLVPPEMPTASSCGHPPLHLVRPRS